MKGEAGVQCPNCGHETRGQFCTACGARVAQVRANVRETPHFRIHYTARSFAEQNADLIGSRLEGAYEAITSLLGIDLRGALIDVYLSALVVEYEGQRLGGGGYAIPRRMQIHDVYLPDAPGDSLERSLLVLLLALAVGDDREPAPLLVDGLLAHVMRRLGSFPGDEHVMAQLAEAKGRNELPPIATLISGPAPATQDVYYAAAAGFMGFLLNTYGLDSLKTFTRELDAGLVGDHQLVGALDAAARAAYKQSIAELDKAWNKTIKAPKPAGTARFVQQSGRYLRPYKLQVAEILVYISIAVAFTIGLAKFQGLLIDKALVPRDKHALLVIMAALVAAFVIQSLASLRQSYVTAHVSESVLREMRLRMFALIQRLHPGYFQTTRTGDIISRLTSDVAAIQFALTGSMATGLRMMLTLVVALVTIFVTDWKLAAIGVAGMPLFFVSTHWLGPAAARASKERQRQLANTTNTVQENLGAQPVVKAFGLQDRMVADYADNLNTLFRASLRLTFLSGIYSLSATSVATGINLTVMGVGAWLVIGGSITIGTLVAFLALMAQVIAPVQNLSSILQGFQQASGAMDRVEEMLKVEPAIKDAPDARQIGPLSRAIQLENLSFGYTDAQTNLCNLNFTVPAGSNVALVGPSGCGKSTILNMIMRFYDPSQGCVTFDGIDIREATLDSVRGQMGVVFQDNLLFNTSVRENIRLGHLQASDQEVEEACRAAEIHELIMSMPDGYDTVVGERGSRLSGGQRQRMAIARAILRNPAILVLDEATSALDPRTEAAINETLSRIGHGRTTISVTHRLSSVVNADRIYVLDRGSLVEDGTHDELLQREGLYAQLWQEQGGAGQRAAIGVDASRLQAIPIFSQLDPVSLDSLVRRLLIERYAAGETIITQGEAGDRLYLVERGQVEVLASGPIGDRRPLAILREGDHFGEMALLRDAPRAATVRARTPVEVYSLSKQDFNGLLKSMPRLRDLMEQVVAQRERALASALSAARPSPLTSHPA